MTRATHDFDARLDLAWRDFREWLADTLLGLPDGDAVDVGELHPDLDHPTETSPRRLDVFVHRDGDTFVVWCCDHSRTVPRALDSGEVCRRLAARGLEPRRRHELVYERRYDRARVDELAVAVVGVVREDLGVLHPLLLDLGEDHWEPSAPAPSASPTASLDALVAQVPRPPAIAWPTSAEELDRLVDVTLLPLIGDLPQRDGDGDVPITCGDGMVWVSSHTDGTRLRLTSFLVDGVTDDAAGLAEAGRINREFDVVKARYADGSLQLVVDVRTEPFVATVVRREVGALCGFVTTFGASTAAAVGGRTWLGEVPPEPGPVPTAGSARSRPGGGVTLAGQVERAGRRLRQLRALEPGRLAPEDVATVCGDDPDVVVELVELAEARLGEWCEQRDAVAPGRPGADPDEHRVLEAEREVAAAWLLTLRRALRLLVLP